MKDTSKKTKGKLLVTCRVADVLIKECAEHGYEIDQQVDLRAFEIKEAVKNAVGMVVRSRPPIDRSILEAAPNLKFVARLGSGMEHIDREAANELGIACLNSPEGNSPSVAEHCVAFMIALLKQIVWQDGKIRSGQWIRKDEVGKDLSEQTVGLIGYGNTGSRLAKLLKPFGCRIMVYDKYKSSFGDDRVEESSMEDLHELCDIISIHLPLNAETHHLVNTTFLNLFRKPIYVINSSRGPIADTEALLSALKSGQVLGAALDVFETEPLTGEAGKKEIWYKELMENKQVILTPHIAGVSRDAYHRMAATLSQKIQEHF